MKKSLTIITILILTTILASCASNPGENVKNTYEQISAEEAKEIMDQQSGYIILDVRTKEEYDQGHIPNAVLLPNETIGTSKIDLLSDKDQMILVYCRSGNRSKQAASKLVNLGYTNIYEFGGIIDWPYDIVTD
ncbi:MAG: rhodanese-like domain-containing protein [Clostridia bacterium]|jgi:rhodanese-related sulfurtransferase|nr:rhodanese-like domain-containing protein [Clostridia bacterium]HQM96570.1 rhodanese-like domain-containing protein [Clostridia bacterium]HQO69528.1 rhodanese-like domain-containing protein [Clostridia bacterium]